MVQREMEILASGVCEGVTGTFRKSTIAELGHEDPTILLTSQSRRSVSLLTSRYAQRMLIVNGIDFFHVDALNPAAPMDEGQLRPSIDTDGQ
jgi:hypothetical protein